MAERGFFRRPFNSERGNIIPPERGDSRFGVITEPRPGTRTPTLPREAPPPPVKGQTTSQPLGDALIRGFERTGNEPRKTGKNRMLITVGSFVGAGLAIAGGVFGVSKVFSGEDNPSSANSQTRSVGSRPEELPNKKGVFDKSAGRRAAIVENERNGKYEMTPPPNRQRENLSKIPSTTTIQDVPHVPEVDARIKNADLKWGFSGSLENQQVLTGKDQQHLEVKTIPPSATINGYIVAKEKQPDGSIMFAVELPYLDSPKDILTRDKESSTPQVIKKDLSSANLPSSRHIQIGGSIVWVKTFEGKNPTYIPFHSTISWGGPGALPTNKSGSGDRPLAEFAQVGDPIQARIPLDPSLQIDPARLDKLLEGYVELHGGSIDAAKQKLKTITKDNLRNAQQLLTDADRNTRIPLESQLKDKRYVFTPGTILFLSQ